MQFYVIETKPKGSESLERFRTDFGYDESVPKGMAPKCPRCGEFVGLLESLPPYRVHLETWGEEFGDLAFWLNEFLVSRRFRDEYLRSGLRGLSAFTRATVLSHRAHGHVSGNPPDYFRVMPSTGAARVDVVSSGVEWEGGRRPTCEHCLSGGSGAIRRWDRVLIEERSWNGEDVFYPFGIPGVLIVSGRFFEWAQKHRFGNLLMIPSHGYGRDPFGRKKE